MKRGINVFLLLLLFTNAFSQTTSREYVVITVEDQYKISQHGIKSYFWIVPVDSITSFSSNLSRLFLSDFSVNNLQDCCAGNPVDPIVVTETSNFKLDDDYLSRLEGLRKLILQSRRKLQKITKKWESGQLETVQVFATAIKGEFCQCDFHPIGQQRTGYKGKVCVPKSSFGSYEEFWKLPQASFILKQDFSSIDFDIISN